MIAEQKKQIRAAFAELRRLGYFVRMNFACCQSCGWAAMSETEAEKAVFYHAQDADAFYEPSAELYLAWQGNAAQIVGVLRKHGFQVEEPPDNSQRIKIKGVVLQ